MIIDHLEQRYPSARTLIEARAASRIASQDATLYDFSPEAQSCANNFLGWVNLATQPPFPLEDIKRFADQAVASGIDTVVLVGQGGSTQAPMTITKYNKIDCNRVTFKTLDSDSPVRVREILASSRPESTLIICASKSGGTLEPRLLLTALRQAFDQTLPEEELVKHLVAITDPGSDLERQAREEGWLAIFPGEARVGGRYSALSVFGLVPAALVGIDIFAMIEHAREAERRCAIDGPENPAINLAAFLYDNYLAGRRKFSLLTPKRGRVLGLWVEQLVAESLGKDGKGILPNIEIDSLMLVDDPLDRAVITYETQTDLWDELRSFQIGLECVDPAIPRLDCRIDSVEKLAEHFVVWEYAIALCGYLMQVCPFDQPDVASAKAAVLDILASGQPKPRFSHPFAPGLPMGEVEVTVAECFAQGSADLRSALYQLLASIQPGDYFAMNAFLPFTGEGRREALEIIRHGIAENFGVASCLEVGPRYLHSTGQLHKGGPNSGVFLIISADEMKDIDLPAGCEAKSLGALAKAQAAGDMATLAQRQRRCAHVHLPDNSGTTLRCLATLITEVIDEVLVDRVINRL